MVMKGFLHILQTSNIEESRSNCFLLYPGQSVIWSYHSANMQSLYSTALPDWVEAAFEDKSSLWEIWPKW